MKAPIDAQPATGGGNLEVASTPTTPATPATPTTPTNHVQLVSATKNETN
jgi:hypothetical protein